MWEGCKRASVFTSCSALLGYLHGVLLGVGSTFSFEAWCVLLALVRADAEWKFCGCTCSTWHGMVAARPDPPDSFQKASNINCSSRAPASTPGSLWLTVELAVWTVSRRRRCRYMRAFGPTWASSSSTDSEKLCAARKQKYVITVPEQGLKAPRFRTPVMSNLRLLWLSGCVPGLQTYVN